ncbi:hypothetical protein SPURM210S_00002 [Streptomyces purpurascens]
MTVVALNAAGSATPVSFGLRNLGFTTGTATPYLTDGSHSTARQPAAWRGCAAGHGSGPLARHLHPHAAGTR